MFYINTRLHILSYPPGSYSRRLLEVFFPITQRDEYCTANNSMQSAGLP